MSMIYASGSVQLEAVSDRIKQLNPEKEWQIEVKPRVRARSVSQNNLMWLWLDDIAKQMSDATGYEKDEIHELFKQNFLDGKRIEVEGLTANKVTTTKLSVSEMTDYLNREKRYGRIFNAYETGGFLIHELAPHSRVYIDGRGREEYESFKSYFIRDEILDLL